MMRLSLVILSLSLLVSGCVYRLTVSAADGERLSGRYRFGRDDTGLVQLIGPGGEVLMGKLFRVARSTFIEGYQKTFGTGSIAVDGPEVSFSGNGFGGIFGNRSALKDAAYGPTFGGAAGAAGRRVTGTLDYWTASLQGDNGSAIGCYFIRSTYTAQGLGRCKSDTGKEYDAEL
jgi:hypothetical protein